MALSNTVGKGLSALVDFTSDTVLDTDSGAILDQVCAMDGQSHGLEINTGFNPAGPQAM